MKKIIPTEHDEAIALADYLTAKGYLFSHIPQETFTKSWGTKMRNKREGVHKGVPDYIIIIRTKTCFIELKRTKGGVVSPEQQLWIDALNDCGCPSIIARGADEAIDFIEQIAKDKISS